jgi:hypothetical protein
MYARRDAVTALIAAVREEEHAALAALREQWVLKERAEQEAVRMVTGQGIEARKQRGPRRPGGRNLKLRQQRPG